MKHDKRTRLAHRSVNELAWQLEQQVIRVQALIAHGRYEQMSGQEAAVAVTDEVIRLIKDEEVEVYQKFGLLPR